MKSLLIVLFFATVSMAQDTLATKLDRHFYCGTDNKWHCDNGVLAPKDGGVPTNCAMPASGTVDTPQNECRDSSWSCPVGTGAILRRDGKYACRKGVARGKRIPREAQ